MRLKSKNFTRETAPKHRKLELKIDVEVRLGPAVNNDSYFSSDGLCKIKVDKSLVSTTDTKLKELKDEIISSIEKQFDELEVLLENSSNLSEGFWSELKDKEERPF